jgi:hypothetical protein
MTTYFGFAIADGMFPATSNASRRPISVEEVKAKMSAGYTSCCNPQHRATNTAAKKRYGLDITVPEKASMVSLKAGDEVIVMSVRGLPRLEENRHEYTEQEIEKATFAFGHWTVTSAD